MTQVTPELLASLAGIVLSLLFSYVPALNVWFANKSPEIKRAVMLGLVVVVGAAVGGLSCAGVISAIPCTQDGWVTLVKTVIAVAIANQSTYAISPQLKVVKLASAEASKTAIA